MRTKPLKIGPEHLINRELSWLAFNERVLEESLDASTPLLERVKFFCMFSANLDEFFETRVAGIKQQIESAPAHRSPDGLTPTETFRAINRRVRGLVARQYACWRNDLRVDLAKSGICFFHFKELSKADTEWVDEFYRAQVRPVLTPLGLDPAHPFPKLLNKSLNSIVQMDLSERGERRRRLAVVQVPRVLPRLVKLPRRKLHEQHYLFLGDLIGHYQANLFPGADILGYWHFRVTRNTELYSDPEAGADLLKPVEGELRNRRQGEAVRLEVEQGCPLEIRVLLLENLGLGEDDLFIIDGPLNPIRLMAVAEGDHWPELRDPPFVAPVAAELRDERDLFAAIRRSDALLHHPYENFASVSDFLRQAAADPKVLAIKQTLYRTGGDGPIFAGLMEAVRNGKQVTAVVELKGRSEESGSALWARRLEEAGVHVVYGLVGCKVHAKMCLVVRKDDDAIRRYLHLSTGNYNPSTARYYTDVGLLTCRPEYGEDATNLFNLLTGICQFPGTKKLVVAPFELHARMMGLIEREIGQAKEGLPARIIAKMNALEDPGMIAALYRASQAGVKIDLIVRGICCLRPRVAGLSENITVRSIVDRFVEHSRIFYFENACQPEVWLSSADWTPNHFFRRIEVAFPIDDGNLRERLRGQVLETLLQDNVKARFLQANAAYTRPKPRRNGPARRSQIELLAAANARQESETALSKAAPKYPRFKLEPGPYSQKQE
ncbi:MAG TPA: polyphosphate kinase 1 [Candidatus Baltobacteraceae bacterium]|jgi:polyphosphate kinase|nr:polyphosphate kinase 1 [Candidatus Baltobacteraceae bacterium]